jgi:hypothetical protein
MDNKNNIQKSHDKAVRNISTDSKNLSDTIKSGKSQKMILGSMKGHKNKNYKILSSKIILFTILIIILFLIGLLTLILINQDNTKSNTTQISNQQINEMITKNAIDKKGKLPKDDAPIEQKKLFYEEYLEILIASGNKKEIQDVYLNKIIPNNISFDRELQDKIAEIFLTNGRPDIAKKIYQDSLTQAKNNLEKSKLDDKSIFENDIKFYELRISNL